jgi:DNA-binding protein HU-beta
MTKEGLIEEIVKKINCSKKDASEALEAVIDAITKSLAKGEDVTITGFGTFTAKKRAARQGVNPKTGEKISIPAMTVPKFKAGKGLKEAVK